MSRFFSHKYDDLSPYTPGEQPQDQKYVKLNTNESPYPPSELSQLYGRDALSALQLYPDPDCKALSAELGRLYGLSSDQIIWTNGSDDVLNFAFMAFCDKDHPAAFPQISYGFYEVFAKAQGIPYRGIPLNSDFTINVSDYENLNHTIFIANPNAPTGLALSIDDIRRILKSNPNNVVVIDEAYVDFGAESAVKLISEFENLLVTQTFSKSRSMAGARLGFGMGNPNLIRDLNTIKYSTNPYAINRVTMACGIGTLKDQKTVSERCEKIKNTRNETLSKLRSMGFLGTDSLANFIFVKHPLVDGQELYLSLKKKGILVRHFSNPLISDYIRVTIGSEEEMTQFLSACKGILEEKQV